MSQTYIISPKSWGDPFEAREDFPACPECEGEVWVFLALTRSVMHLCSRCGYVYDKTLRRE